MIDMEHGPIEFETAYSMVTALVSTSVPRPGSGDSSNDARLIKRALDTGCETSWC